MTQTSERSEERGTLTTDRFTRPAHVVARSVGTVARCARTCVGAVRKVGTWTSRALARPSRAVALAAGQFASVVARPFKRLWRRPLAERVMVICAGVAAITFLVTLLAALAEPGTGVVRAIGEAVAAAIGFLWFGLFFLALGNLPRAGRWIMHVVEIASVELHRERRARHLGGIDRAVTIGDELTQPGRLEIVVVDSSAAVPEPWQLHRILRRAARIAIDSLPDGTPFAVLAAADGEVRALFPVDGTLASASSESRRDAVVHLRLLWPSGELDLDRALRSARDLVTVAGPTSAHVTLVIAGTHDSTVRTARTIDRVRGQFRCDVVTCGSGGNAAPSIASALEGLVVRLEDGDVIAAVCGTGERVAQS